jgi:hypothetical protein
MALGDLRSNGKLDVVCVDNTNSKLIVLLGNGDGTFAAPATYTTGTGPALVALGSLRNNGILDAVVTNLTAGTVSVFLGNGDGTFAAKADYTGIASNYAICLGDFTGNGKLDVAVGRGSIVTFLGNGDGTLQAAVTAATPVASSVVLSLAAGDLNGDGKLDLVANNFSGAGTANAQIFLGVGDGTFGSPISLNASGDTQCYACCLGDFNGDGKLDVAASNYATANVSVWLQTTPGIRGESQGTFAITPAGIWRNLPNVAGAYPRVVSGEHRSGAKVEGE